MRERERKEGKRRRWRGGKAGEKERKKGLKKKETMREEGDWDKERRSTDNCRDEWKDDRGRKR